MSKAPATLVSSVLFYSPVRLCLRVRRAVSLTCPAVFSCPWCCFTHLSGCVFVPGMLFHSSVQLCLLAHGAVSFTCPAVSSCPACCFTHLPDRLCSCPACCFTHLSGCVFLPMVLFHSPVRLYVRARHAVSLTCPTGCVRVQRAVSLTCQAVLVSSVLFHSPVKLCSCPAFCFTHLSSCGLVSSVLFNSCFTPVRLWVSVQRAVC